MHTQDCELLSIENILFAFSLVIPMLFVIFVNLLSTMLYRFVFFVDATDLLVSFQPIRRKKMRNICLGERKCLKGKIKGQTRTEKRRSMAQLDTVQSVFRYNCNAWQVTMQNYLWFYIYFILKFCLVCIVTTALHGMLQCKFIDIYFQAGLTFVLQHIIKTCCIILRY